MINFKFISLSFGWLALGAIAPMSSQAMPQSGLQDLLEADTLDQVTSVSQLSDVQPTDWAFQSLQSLVERYGCIAGYPDTTHAFDSGDANTLIALELGIESFKQITPTHKGDRATAGKVIRYLDNGI